MRLVINLKQFNQYPYPLRDFFTESQGLNGESGSEGCLYFTIPIYPQHQQYLKFTIDSNF